MAPRGRPRKSPGGVEAAGAAPAASAAGDAIEQHETMQEPPAHLGPAELGKLARALIGNSAVDESFRRCVAELFKEWEATEPADAAKRESLYHQAHAVRELKRRLIRMDAQGASAERERARLRIA